MIKRKTGAFLAWRAALAAMCAVAGLLGPAGHALGQEVTSGCQFNRNPSQGFDPTRTGADSYLTTFTPLQINLDKTIPVGEVVYETSLPVIPWVCITNIPDRLPYMSSGGYMQTMIKDLASAGLKLVLQINNYPEWTPSSSTTDNRLVLSDVTYAAKSPSDPTMTASGILHGKLKLVMVTPPQQADESVYPRHGKPGRPKFRGFHHECHLDRVQQQHDHCAHTQMHRENIHARPDQSGKSLRRKPPSATAARGFHNHCGLR